MMKPLTILIDGYNVSRNMRGSRLEDGVALATARENLLAMVSQRFRGTPYHVAVIFDGNGEREVCEPIKGLHGGKCIFTQRDTSGRCGDRAAGSRGKRRGASRGRLHQ